MIISKKDEVRQLINRLIDTNNININVADMLNLAFSYTDIIDIESVKQSSLSEQEAIIDQLYDFYRLDKDNEDNQLIIKEFFLDRLKKLNPDDYLSNPYVKTIKEAGRYNKYSLKMIEYAPYQLFPYDEITVTKDYKEYSAIGYFDKPFSYLALTEGNNIWMSLNPNEIETMKPFINKAKGNVLVLGLGLGYVPFMMSLKEEVKHITIIEKDPDIINLFNKMIFPSFKNQNKISIIKDDAINYAKSHQKYDYIFADLWHSPEDGLPLFIKLKKINKNIDCWLETSHIALLRRCMLSLIEEILQGSSDADYKRYRNYTDKVINDYYFKTKNIQVSNQDVLDSLLSDKNLLKLILE